MNYATRICITALMLLPCCSIAIGQDTVSVAAGERYGPKSTVHRMVMGSNYRQEWATPVKMPVFDIGKEQGGLIILKLGGGMQTKSLRLEDSNGYKWVLRTVDKDVTPLFPKIMRWSPARAGVQDMISASHPYAALVVSALSDALGIAAPHPRLFYVPADVDFGEYSYALAGKVCFFEERSPTHNRKSDDYEEISDKLAKEHNTYVVLQREILKARLLDMLVADWDRHEGQYRFGIKDSAGKKYIYPVPVDRDQAFFKSDGLFAGVAGMFTPFLKGFHADPGNLKKLNHKALEFDRMMLGRLNAEDWVHAITTLQATLTDSVIDLAVKQLPPEIYDISGAQIAQKLKSRRDALHRPAMKYYSFISKDNND